MALLLLSPSPHDEKTQTHEQPLVATVMTCLRKQLLNYSASHLCKLHRLLWRYDFLKGEKSSIPRGRDVGEEAGEEAGEDQEFCSRIPTLLTGLG